MELGRLRSLIDTTPDPTHPEIDDQARAWLASAGLDVQVSDGGPVVLLAFAVDEDADIRVFAVPGERFDARAHEDLAAVHRAAFEFFFMSDLTPEQFAGALRFCGGASEEPDVWEDQVAEVEEDGEVTGLDVETIRGTVGTWNAFRVHSGDTLRGPISHVYATTLCM